MMNILMSAVISLVIISGIGAVKYACIKELKKANRNMGGVA
ncbi:MAG: hypothetical protein SPL99_09080 [Catonella sp.]|nr:hypothetical protein [Catonella sp.]MDY6357196.1 hypothetical protein [Catonella sp.]